MSARYCAQCAAALVVGPIAGRSRPHCPACGYIVFCNPVPVGLAVAERQGRLLLTRRGNPPLQGYWAPPAGHVELDESVEAATIREAHEEAGVAVALDRLAGVFSQAQIGVVIVAYHARVVDGEARAGEDAEAVGYFGPGELPWQPPPQARTAMDDWFYGVLQTLLAPWRGVSQ
jgi:ADP-ribose pyrophosphatase YjhB (NUDIX family)